jgi:hypothetical protein
MKNMVRPNILPWFTLGCGGLGLALRLWLYSNMDEKGLLPAGHPAQALLFILTALTLAVIFLCVRELKPVDKYIGLFPAGIGRALGCAAGALGVVAGAVFELGSDVGLLGIPVFVTGILAAISLGLTAFYRLQGKRPSFLLHTALTVFFMLYTVARCRTWSAEPQLQEYVFALFACVCLMLTGYYLSVADTRKSGRRWLVFSNQAALFFCCLSLNGENRLFYLGMLLWLALDLCSVDLRSEPQNTSSGEET